AYFAFTYKHDIERNLKTSIAREFRKWNFSNTPSEVKKSIQCVQTSFKCCGVTDYRLDYYAVLPASCCDQWSKGDSADKTCYEWEVRHREGCMDKVEN
ncbi:unnamed protein product, partial [Oppiella nova]